MSETPKVTATIMDRQVEFDSPDSALLFIAHFANPLQFHFFHTKLKGQPPPGKLQRQLKAKTKEFGEMLQTLCFTDGTPFYEVFGKGGI
ncbi:MAG: hypothetical protein K8L97_15185 [Anaerolineae bacterium]|nr:hypothetical protein [Anaerolineae bacterium]